MNTNIPDMVLHLIKKYFFSLGNKIGWNVITFGVDMSSSPHIDNKKKDLLIIGKVSTQGP